MRFRCFVLALAASVALHAAAKKNTVATAKAENEDLMLTVTLHIDPADIKELIGNDLGGHYIVAEVKVEPKFGKDILLDRDDFQLRTDKDGEKAKPYAGSQIAGTGALDHRARSTATKASPRPDGPAPGFRSSAAAAHPRKDPDKDKDRQRCRQGRSSRQGRSAARREGKPAQEDTGREDPPRRQDQSARARPALLPHGEAEDEGPGAHLRRQGESDPPPLQTAEREVRCQRSPLR